MKTDFKNFEELYDMKIFNEAYACGCEGDTFSGDGVTVLDTRPVDSISFRRKFDRDFGKYQLEVEKMGVAVDQARATLNDRYNRALKSFADIGTIISTQIKPASTKEEVKKAIEATGLPKRVFEKSVKWMDDVTDHYNEAMNVSNKLDEIYKFIHTPGMTFIKPKIELFNKDKDDEAEKYEKWTPRVPAGYKHHLKLLEKHSDKIFERLKDFNGDPSFIGKLWGGLKAAALAPARGIALMMIRQNIQGMAKIFQKNSKKADVEKKWEMLGGNIDKLNKNIEIGAKKKMKKNKDEIDSSDINFLGGGMFSKFRNKNSYGFLNADQQGENTSEIPQSNTGNADVDKEVNEITKNMSPADIQKMADAAAALAAAKGDADKAGKTNDTMEKLKIIVGAAGAAITAVLAATGAGAAAAAYVGAATGLIIAILQIVPSEDAENALKEAEEEYNKAQEDANQTPTPSGAGNIVNDYLNDQKKRTIKDWVGIILPFLYIEKKK